MTYGSIALLSEHGPKQEIVPRRPTFDLFVLAVPAFMLLFVLAVIAIGTSAKILIMVVALPALMWAAFRNIEHAVYIYIAWCWMDGTIRGVFGSVGLTVIARDIVLLLITIGWLLQRLRRRENDPWRWPPASLLIVLFAVQAFIQIFNPMSMGLVVSLAGLKIHLAIIPLYFICYDTFRRREQRLALATTFALAGVVVCIASVIQYKLGHVWTWAHFPGAESVILQTGHAMTRGTTFVGDSMFRPPATGMMGGCAGAFGGHSVVFLVALLLLGRRTVASAVRARLTIAAIMMLTIVAIFTSGMRSGLIDAIVSLVILGAISGPRLRPKILGALLVCGLFGLSAWTLSISLSNGAVADRFSSTFADPAGALHADRTTMFEEIGQVIAASPLGVGLGRANGMGVLNSGSGDKGDIYAFSESYVDRMIYETGVIGAALIVAIVVVLMVRGYRIVASTSNQDDRLVNAALLTVIVGLLLDFPFISVLSALPGPVLLWACGGALLRAGAKS